MSNWKDLLSPQWVKIPVSGSLFSMCFPGFGSQNIQYYRQVFLSGKLP